MHQARDGVVHVWAEPVVEERSEHPIDDEPCHEQVKTLESMEAHVMLATEPSGGEDDDGRDPSDNRNVAEQGCGARTDAINVLRRRRGTGTRLRAATPGAVGVRVGHAVPAFAAKRHSAIPYCYLCWRGRGSSVVRTGARHRSERWQGFPICATVLSV